jgi:hypothetical protein
MNPHSNHLLRFGFRFQRNGAHVARTMMLSELGMLLSYVDNDRASRDDYLRVIREENCLGKRSVRSRALSVTHLTDLYSLDPTKTLFRCLRYLWSRDPAGQPLLALLLAYARDSVLRSTAPFLLHLQRGERFVREQLEQHIDALESGRFSSATLTSVAQNTASTWTQSGHLRGRFNKVRAGAVATPGSAAFALFLGYLTGHRGDVLFRTEYAKLLDCSFERAVELAMDASQRGWIVTNRVGDVVEVLFPNLIDEREMEWLREQN